MQWPGTQRQVAELVEAHYRPLYCYAFRLSGCSSTAEDLVQEAFCQAQTKLAQLRDRAKAKSWLFSILRNAYLHRRRSMKVENAVSLEELSELPDRPAEPLPELEPERLQEELNALPEDFRTPLILFYFEDSSYKDIAEQMDLPLGTVMSRLARAKAHLRSRLAAAETGSSNGQRRVIHGL